MVTTADILTELEIVNDVIKRQKEDYDESIIYKNKLKVDLQNSCLKKFKPTISKKDRYTKSGILKELRELCSEKKSLQNAVSSCYYDRVEIEYIECETCGLKVEL